MMTLVIAAIGLTVVATPTAQDEDQDAAQQAVRDVGNQLVSAFNKADARELAALFTPQAELVDEAGTVYRGRDEIAAMLSKFFERFPGASMERQVESNRPVSPSLIIQDGILTISAPAPAPRDDESSEPETEEATPNDEVSNDEPTTAIIGYTHVYLKRQDGWQIASARHSTEGPVPKPGDRLDALDWLVGTWISEGADREVVLTCRRSESGQFLLGSIVVKTPNGQPVLNSELRIGWDPVDATVQAWVFDSDGGFAEWEWATDGANWVVRSAVTLPNGQTGSATLYFEPDGPDRFTWRTVDRVLGGVVQPDVRAIMVRQPPEPKR